MTTVIAFDPSMRNWGVAVMQWDRKKLVLLHSETIRINTIGLPKNQELLVIAEQTYARITELVKEYVPTAILAEIPHGSQSANAMKSYAYCITVLGILKAMGIPLLTVSAYDVKTVVGSTNTTKKDIVAWVSKKYPKAFTQNRSNKISVTEYEHIADAILVVHAHLLSKGYSL